MLNKTKIYPLSKYKELIISSLVMLICLILSFQFPIKGTFQYVTLAIFFLILVPVLHIKIVLGKKLSAFGINLKKKPQGIFLGVIGFLFLCLFFFLLYSFTPFQQKYSLPETVVGNFWAFLFYEMIIANFLILVWGFFFLGFSFFTFLEKFSYWTIPLQMLFFSATLFFLTGLSWQSIPALAIFLISGIITYRTHSIVYSYPLALFFNFILDSFIIYHLK
jgi:hypothetical protein